jgi:hypothetical protein
MEDEKGVVSAVPGGLVQGLSTVLDHILLTWWSYHNTNPLDAGLRDSCKTYI